MVYANSVACWFGGAIGLLFIWTAVWLGWKAWTIDEPHPHWHSMVRKEHFDLHIAPSASFGHLVELLCPAVGMLGTVVGLSLAFRDAGSPEMFKGATTAFYSTGCGIAAMILVMIMTASLGECRG